MRAPLRARLSLLLAVVVLTISTSPPVLEHSHVGGGVPHDHHGTRETHPYPAEGAGHHVHPSGESHFHLCLFGFDFSLPNQSGEGNHERHEPMLLCLLRQTSWTTRMVPSADFANQLAVTDGPDSFLKATQLCLVERSPQLHAQPLCAKALHQRSGVQLS